MPKLILNHSLCKSKVRTLTRTLEKESTRLPQLKASSVYKGQSYKTGLIKTEALYINNIINPALKQIDCSRIQNLRFSDIAQVERDLKTQIKSFAFKEITNQKQNNSSLKNLSSQKPSQFDKLNLISKLQQNEMSKFKIVGQMKQKFNNQTLPYRKQSNKDSLTQRNSKVSSKEKISVCRVATKKVGFPFSKKQYEDLKLIQQFEKEEEKLSIIPIQQAQKFISFQSYAQLVAF